MDLQRLNKFANNKCTPKEVDDILGCIQRAEDQSGQVVFKQYWEEVKPDDITDSNEYQQRLDKIHHKINISHSENNLQGSERKSYDKKTIILRVLSRAAVIILIPVITILVYTQFFQNTFIASNEITSPPGSRTFLELSDGTKVWLNHGSKMVYPQHFTGKKRIVSLIGEGYFEVAHNPEKPFIVEAGGLQIKALGTTFNVKAYADDDHFETTLESGKIQVQQIAMK